MTQWNKELYRPLNVVTVQQISFQGYCIRLERKKMKSLRMRIRASDGMIIVSAPYDVSRQVIFNFIQQHQDWLDEHVPKVRARLHRQSKDKTSFRLWGQKYPIRSYVAPRLIVHLSLIHI